jgi:hypothetical protein
MVRGFGVAALGAVVALLAAHALESLSSGQQFGAGRRMLLVLLTALTFLAGDLVSRF